ncbi:YdcF family protein [Hymenobacter sp. BRD128]|uniref:YdcF family protein n=1 Tax=Hymenobacter sp. BRD128 TaxID=2675878 RepID=UPI001563555E|nr:YdcF family protein [Hymenobacter sp. BRD128]QKG56724.1 YdcF family protein [Hymenobacter sp. BRD128]
MFFLLSKLLDFVLLPAVWLVALLLGAWLARPDSRARRRWLGAALLVTLISTSNALINEALLAWEVPAVPLAAVAPADAAVLLTGITIGDKSPHDRVYLSRGADRFTNALWLYRAGRVRQIIISGGSGAVLRTQGTEAGNLRTLLLLAGVPDSAILLEERSRNTRENALFTHALLARHPDIKSLVLVTSAFHERRALGCFARVGLRAQAFPADFRTSDRSWAPDYWLLPDANALICWSLLLHEVSGWLVYKAAGYC